MNIIPHTAGKTRHATCRGFTIVETLVAVAILMISIAGPLVIASKGLRAALYSRDQMIASLLAQESMEIVKNIRSNNITSGSNWVQSLDTCLLNSPCDANAVSSTPIWIGCSTTGCPLYFSAGYTPEFVGEETLFRRMFFLTPMPGQPNEYTVNVVVSWTEGTVPNELHVTSQLTNSTR
ncbi:MAG: prepilin-type N-terminal cleavage/methylation domain-containing protein [Patescibacteria group bacterium]